MLAPIGTRVKVVRNVGNHQLPFGSIGTVVGHYDSLFSDDIVQVEWDDYCAGHNCDGLAKKGHGWNVSMSMIREIFDDAEEDENIDLSELL